jgi:SAM-dependent methyltransferase
LLERAGGLVPDAIAVRLVAAWLASVAHRPATVDALRVLLKIDDELGARLNEAAIAYDDGVHAKHRLIGYHDFFVDNVDSLDRVLDVGCGKGELAYDLVVRGGAKVVGIDVYHDALVFARARFRHERLTFIEADAHDYLDSEPFDVIVLSNVLEHIDQRVDLLRRLVSNFKPNRLLIRVPLLERHWLVPLRAELGLWHFGDPTHFVEYDLENFGSELGAAGLTVESAQQRWGEIWAVARPRRDE